MNPDEDSGDPTAKLIEALRRMGQGTDKPAPSEDRSLESRFYEALRDGLAKWEREARRHAEFVEKLLGAKPPEKAASPYQETLYLQGAAGGRTAGRFRAFNRRDKRVSVATLTRPFTLGQQPALEAPALTLRPGAFYLEPGEARVVGVDADLPGPGRYESALDVTMDDAVALKLWIEIDVYS